MKEMEERWEQIKKRWEGNKRDGKKKKVCDFLGVCMCVFVFSSTFILFLWMGLRPRRRRVMESGESRMGEEWMKKRRKENSAHQDDMPRYVCFCSQSTALLCLALLCFALLSLVPPCRRLENELTLESIRDLHGTKTHSQGQGGPRNEQTNHTNTHHTSHQSLCTRNEMTSFLNKREAHTLSLSLSTAW